MMDPLFKWHPGAPLLRKLTNPMVTAPLFIANMWLWHAPQLYEAALTNLQVHALMHMTFIASGLLFWWPVIQPSSLVSRISDGGRLLYLFVTGFPMAMLALLFIASNTVVYPYYVQAVPLWGISPIEDQQIAGLVMGVLGELASFIAISLLFLRFLDRDEQAQEANQAARAATSTVLPVDPSR
jgi:cytochrome c oxidase assembly factor CtaG